MYRNSTVRFSDQIYTCEGENHSPSKFKMPRVALMFCHIALQASCMLHQTKPENEHFSHTIHSCHICSHHRTHHVKVKISQPCAALSESLVFLRLLPLTCMCMNVRKMQKFLHASWSSSTMHEYKLYPRLLGGETSDSNSSDLTLSFFCSYASLQQPCAQPSLHLSAVACSTLVEHMHAEAAPQTTIFEADTGHGSTSCS